MNSIYFSYNGKTSDEIGVYLVSVESGMKETPFLSEREIISETVAGNDIPYVYRYARNPLVVNITLSTLDDLWTFEKRREVARMLDIDSFEEFYTTDNIDKKYFLAYTGGIDLTHNGNEQGYLNIQMLNISPFTYSPMYTNTYIFANETRIIEFTNYGDNSLYPEMWIKQKSDGNVSIKNLSNGGKIFEFVDLTLGEEVYIDNKNHDIETDLSLTYRYDNFNNNYLELLRGVNRLEVTGDCDITFRYRFEIKG